MDISKNKELFCNLLKQITRENSRIDVLISKLEASDFFTAPASSMYHNAVKGGLCEHCLNVYNELTQLVSSHNLQEVISKESIIVTALLHDLSKMDYYEPSVINKKIYSVEGKKNDELGNFDWKSIPGYKVKDSTNRFLFGTHEETAEFMARCFIPLTIEESIAILHHSGFAGHNTGYDLTSIYNNYTLALLLHLADMLATYLDERI